MPGPRVSTRRRSSQLRRGVIFFAVFGILGYGFYLQTRDFHPEKEGFQRHRKELREVEKPVLQAVSPPLPPAPVKATEGAPQIPAETQAALPAKTAEPGNGSASNQTGTAVPTATARPAPAASIVAAEAEEKEVDAKREAIVEADAGRHESTLNSLVQEQELRMEEGSGFHPLPKAGNSTEQDATEVKKYVTRWRTYNVTAESSTTEQEWGERQAAVRLATQETWAVYEKYAMGQDELRPLSLEGKTSLGGLSATLVDSLDTLWMMGLKPEFERARKWVADNLNFDKQAKLSLFETTIRIVGGLLSAFDLSEDRMFLEKARTLVDMLMPVFDTATTGIPNNVVYINQGETGKTRGSQVGRVALAEFGSIQVELLALSQRTANASYGEKSEAILKLLNRNYPDKAMLPIWFNRRQGRVSSSNQYTVGAMADSYFEYLLKMWLLHQKQEELYRGMWERATDEILEKLVGVSPQGLTFLGQKRHIGKLVGKMEHLACYFPGNMALGVAEGAVAGAKAQHYLEVAGNLTYTCWQMYERTASGLGMDVAIFDDKGDLQPSKGKGNMLRPEAVESLFYMWRVTGEPKYREWGWRMFQAFQKHSRTKEGAFASVKDVNTVPVELEDGMESFWVAETLKYMWLLFGPDELLSLDDWVLNTEAHPLKISLLAHSL